MNAADSGEQIVANFAAMSGSRWIRRRVDVAVLTRPASQHSLANLMAPLLKFCDESTSRAIWTSRLSAVADDFPALFFALTSMPANRVHFDSKVSHVLSPFEVAQKFKF